MDRREARRRRRIRNQIISYIAAAIFLAGIICVGLLGIRYISGIMAERRKQQETADVEETVESPEEETEAVFPEEETAAAETEAAPTREELLEELVEGCIENMSLEDKVAGLFIITPEQLTGVGTAVQAGDGTRDALAEYPVGGLVYFSKNIQSPEQIREMLAKTTEFSKYPLFLAVEEEGGQVARVADALGLDNAGDMSAVGAGQDPQAARSAYAAIGGYLREYGFNLDFAPVADVLTNPENQVMGDRSFGSDPQLVSGMVSAAVAGLKESGVSACLKYFPGYGGATGDSDEGQVETDRTKEEMQAAEFLPFSAGIEAGADMVMVGHISAPGLTGEDSLPASVNEGIITDILRKQLGYDGIVITDAMNMAAISEYYAADEAAVKALKAGADMILMPEDFVTAYEGVLAAVQNGTIDERRIDDSLRRVYRVKYAGTLQE